MVSHSAVYSTDFIDVPSNPSISSSVNFANDITFSINQSGDTFIVGKESYFSIGLQIAMTREDASIHPLEPIINSATTNSRATPLVLSVPYIAPNPAMCLFQNVACTLKGEQISSYQYVPQTNTAYRLLCENDQEQKFIQSTNPINLLSLEDQSVVKGAQYDEYAKVLSDIGATGATGGSNMFSKHMIWALKNNSKLGYNKYNIQKLNFQAPLPLFFADEMLNFGDGKCEITFNVEPNWYKQIIQIAGSNSCTVTNGIDYTVVNSAPAASPCQIQVNITDFRLHLCRAHVTSSHIPRSISQTIFMKQFCPYVTQLANGNNTIVAPMKSNRRITDIVVAFFVSNPTDKFKSTPSDFSCSFSKDTTTESKNTTDVISQLSNVSLQYGGFTLPQVSYNLQTSTSTAGGYTNNDMGRAYYDFLVLSGAFKTGNSIMTFSQFCAQPIFIFKTRNSPNDVGNNNAYLTVNTTSTATNSSVLVLGMYDENLTLSYDEFNRLVGLKLDSA